MNGAKKTDLKVDDFKQRLSALMPTRSFIVQAPAGSGKTELLTQRFLHLLALVEKPEEILAMTFTRKAAGEMRQRILSALQEANAQSAVNDEYEIRRRELAEQVLRRDREKSWRLLEYPSRLKLTTIDGFNAVLARQMPYLAGRGLPLEISDDADSLYREAARRQLAQSDTDAGSAEAGLLGHLDNRFASTVDLLAKMLKARMHWLRRIEPGGDHTGLREQLEKALERQVHRQITVLRQTLSKDAAKTLQELVAVALRNQPELAVPFARSAEQILDLNSLEFWQFGAFLLLTSAGPNWRKTVNKSTGFPPGESHKQNMVEFLDSLVGRDSLARQLDEIRLLPRQAFPDEQWRVLENLLQVLPACAAQLQLVFGEHGAVDYPAVAGAALTALGKPERPTDLALALDYRIRHILVDEFQDTSFEQVQMLNMLTAGWQPDDDRTLFLVGDPMQSIYRFREAEVALFMECWRNGLDGGRVALEPLVLSANFRSQKGIVDWFNQTFATVMPDEEDLAEGKVRFSKSDAVNDSLAGEGVIMHAQLEDDRDVEAETISELVAEALKDQDATIAILVRSRKHLNHILPNLRRKGLVFQTLDTEALGERPVIQDLLALTRAILHPADRGAWLAVLRAPWCGLSLADLYQLMGENRKAAVPQLLESIDIRKLCDDGAKRVIRVRETLLTCLAERGRKSLRARLEGVWLALGGPAVLSESADIDNAESYFRLLENLDQSGEPEELSRIEEKLKGLYAAPDPKSDSRFQIMTIHKAKGLEFDTVIIPGLGRRPANADKPLLRWMSVVGESKGEEELLMAPLSATGNEKDPFFGLLKNIEDRRDLYETDRLLYVACTRARKKLHLLGHAKASGKDLQPKAAKGSLLHRLWPILEPEFLKLQAKPGSIDIRKVEVAHPKLNRLPGRWTLPELPSVKTKSQLADAGEEIDAAIEFDWAKESLRMIGTVVHGELEQVGRQGIGTWSESRVNQNSDYYRTRLLTLGHPDVGLDDAVANVKLSLCNTLEDETGRWILSEKKEARCELAISGVLDGEMISVILDRTFVDADGRRWIIDYKTSRHGGSDLESFLDLQQQRYCDQLERYARLMREIDDRPIRLGLYFPLLKSWREWSPVP